MSYNTKDFLDKCIEFIYENTFAREEYEIIVIDNCSSDQTVENLSKKYTQAKWIGLKENVGFAKANNIGVQESSKTDYVFFLNPDTLLEKNVLEKLVSYLDKHKDVGIVSPFVQLANGEIDDACHRGFPTPWNAFCYFIGLARLFPNSHWFNGYHLGYKNLAKPHEIDACTGAAMLVRQEAGKAINWWDEDYFWYGEDLDFCYRAKKAGWKTMFYPYVKILHYKGVAGGIKKLSKKITTADKKTRKLAQNARFEAMEIFYKKHYAKKYPRIVTWTVLGGIKLFKASDKFNIFTLLNGCMVKKLI